MILFKEKRYLEHAPTQLMKAVKNQVERENYRKCQIRDSRVLIEFLAFIENEVFSYY